MKPSTPRSAGHGVFLDDLSARFPALQWHGAEIVRLPNGATVGKQLAARNGEEQMMQGGDLLGAVRSALIDLLVDTGTRAADARPHRACLPERGPLP